MNVRRLTTVLGSCLAATVAAGMFGGAAVQAGPVTTGTEWQDVVELTDPPRTLTMLDLERMGEQASHQSLAPADQAVVFASDREPTWEEIAAVLAGQPDPGIRIYGVVDTTPTTTAGDITTGVPVPQAAKAVFKLTCNYKGKCKLKIKIIFS
jgi:hypothetical protein